MAHTYPALVLMVLISIVCMSRLTISADPELISADVTGFEDIDGATITVTATKIAAAFASITFGRLGATLECPTTKTGLKQPDLFDPMLGATLGETQLQNGLWKVSDANYGERVYTANVYGAMLRSLWQQREARGLEHAVSVTGGSVSALVLACVMRQNEDDSVETLDSVVVELCMNRADSFIRHVDDQPSSSCTVPRAVLTGVYGSLPGDLHLSLETRVHPSCLEDPASGLHYLKGGFVKVFDVDSGSISASVVPMGASARGCEDEISVSDTIVECLQTWDVVVSGMPADTTVMNVAAGFAVIGKTCAGEIVVQVSVSIDNNNDAPDSHAHAPIHPQEVATSTNHLHVQVRTVTESARSDVHMRGLGDGAKAYAFNDGERNCLEIRSDHPSLLDDHTSLLLRNVVLHRCAPRAVQSAVAARRTIAHDDIVIPGDAEPVANECIASGDIVLVRNGFTNHGFSGFMNGRIARDETTVSLCFTPNVDVFEAGTLEVEWAIDRVQTQVERRAERAQQQQRPATDRRWKPALELELEEQARRRAREEEAAAAGIDLEERCIGCHGPECNGTIIIPIHVGCQDSFFFVHHLNQCVPWPVYSGLRFMRVAWIPCLLVFIVIALTCVICYGVMSRRSEMGDFEGHKMH